MNPEILSDVLAGKREIIINNERYVISPLTLGDWADFQAFILQKKIDRSLIALKKVYGDNIPQPALSAVLNQTISDEETEKACESIEYVFFLLWRSLNKTRPDITLDKARELLTTDNIVEITNILSNPVNTDKTKTDNQKKA